MDLIIMLKSIKNTLTALSMVYQYVTSKEAPPMELNGPKKSFLAVIERHELDVLICLVNHKLNETPINGSIRLKPELRTGWSNLLFLQSQLHKLRD